MIQSCSFFCYQIFVGVSSGFGLILFSRLLRHPSCPIECHVDHQAISSLAGEDKQVHFVPLVDEGTEIKAEVLDQKNSALGVLSFDGLSGVAGFRYGLVVDSEICVLDIVSSLPIVVLGEGDIESPLELGRAGDELAAAEFADGAASGFQTFIAGDRAGQGEGED